MCEIIVKAIDAANADPVKDQRGCYKRGHPVAVFPDGHKWGAEERLPKFIIIKLPGVPVDDPKVQEYVNPHIEPTQQTRKRNILEWNKAKADKRFDEFLSEPVVSKTTDEQFEEIVTPDQWKEMQDKGEYHPFLEKPTSEALVGEIVGIKLTGTVRSVDLQGDVNTTITRRLWKIDLDSLPKKSLDKVNAEGELVVDAGGKAVDKKDHTWTEVKGLFKNKKTGLAETAEL